MTAKDAIRTTLNTSQFLLPMYLADLSDADLLVRPVPSANHIAWQLGHTISSEKGMLSSLPEASFPPLPAGFDERHHMTAASSEETTGWATKQQYLDLFTQTRQATLTLLDRLADADLDRPNAIMPEFAPTVGALFVLAANHIMMHAGQFSVIRRKLGKPVLF